MASRAIARSSAAVAAPQFPLGSFGCTFAITTLVDPVGSMRPSMGEHGFPIHVQLAEDLRPLASLEPPAPVPPPAAVHWHPVEAPLGPEEGDDGVAEADAAFYFWCPEETPQDTAVADAAGETSATPCASGATPKA